MTFVIKILLIFVLFVFSCLVSVTAVETNTLRGRNHHYHHHQSQHAQQAVWNIDAWYRWGDIAENLGNISPTKIRDWKLKRFDICNKFVHDTIVVKQWADQIYELIQHVTTATVGLALSPISAQGVNAAFDAAKCAFTGAAGPGYFKKGTGEGAVDVTEILEPFGGIIVLLLQMATNEDYSCTSCLTTAPDTVFHSVFDHKKELGLPLCGVRLDEIREVEIMNDMRDNRKRSTMKHKYQHHIYHYKDWEHAPTSPHTNAAHSRVVTTAVRDSILDKLINKFRSQVRLAATALKVGLTGVKPSGISSSYDWEQELKDIIKSSDPVLGPTLTLARNTLILAIKAKRIATFVFKGRATEEENCSPCMANSWSKMVSLTHPFSQVSAGYWCWLDFGEAAGNLKPTDPNWIYYPDWWNYVSDLRLATKFYLDSSNSWGLFGHVPNLVLSLGDNLLAGTNDNPLDDLAFSRLLGSEKKLDAYISIFDNLNRLNALWVASLRYKNYHGWSQCPSYFYHPTSVLPLVVAFHKFLTKSTQGLVAEFRIAPSPHRVEFVNSYFTKMVAIDVTLINRESFQKDPMGYVRGVGNIVALAATKMVFTLVDSTVGVVVRTAEMAVDTTKTAAKLAENVADASDKAITSGVDGMSTVFRSVNRAAPGSEVVTVPLDVTVQIVGGVAAGGCKVIKGFFSLFN